jgi:dissimilatory sulfite reductase (desulfoviridin) alpha/beta subunit
VEEVIRPGCLLITTAHLSCQESIKCAAICQVIVDNRQEQLYQLLIILLLMDGVDGNDVDCVRHPFRVMKSRDEQKQVIWEIYDRMKLAMDAVSDSVVATAG